jgi:hypothetical protein
LRHPYPGLAHNEGEFGVMLPAQSLMLTIPTVSTNALMSIIIEDNDRTADDDWYDGSITKWFTLIFTSGWQSGPSEDQSIWL